MNATPTPNTAGTFHRFSPGRVWTLAAATVTQLVRMKVLAFLLVFCALIVAFGFVWPPPSNDPSQILKQLKDWSFAALQVYSVIIAIAATALLLPRDLEDRTLYTILSKPVPRHDYLLGKLLGVLLLIGGSLLVMDLALTGVLWLKQSLLAAELTASLSQRGLPREETRRLLAELVHSQGLTWSLHLAVVAVFLKASVISALALLISCIASSTLFTIVITACVTIVGHGHQLMREYFFHPNFGGLGEKLLSMALAILTPDLGVFDIVENVVGGASVTAPALAWMFGASALYITGYMVVSHLLFVEKEL